MSFPLSMLLNQLLLCPTTKEISFDRLFFKDECFVERGMKSSMEFEWKKFMRNKKKLLTKRVGIE